jgi:regulator of sigma E protease
MQGLIMAAQLIAGISILVILHEFGHYWAARAFGIKVEKFFLFFDAWGKKLYSFKKGATEWGIGWLPLGGYVKIAGMIDESMDKAQMQLPAEPWEFRSKPAWQRLIVMIGGVVMNVITGIFIFAMLTYAYGEKSLVNASVKYGIIPSSLAKEVGFERGDKILSVNGKEIRYFNEALSTDALLSEHTVYTVERNGQQVNITLPKDFVNKFSDAGKENFFSPIRTFYVSDIAPNNSAEKAGIKANDKILKVDTTSFRFFDEFQVLLKKHAGSQTPFTILRGTDTLKLDVAIDKDGKIGIDPGSNDLQFDSVKYSFLQSFPMGIERAAETISLQVKGWSKIFHGDIPANKAVQGPIGIAKFYGGEWIWWRFWTFTALISLGLAFMNILPIPALDGGHVVLLLIEMIAGKPLNDKWMERIQTFGIIILLTLMVLIFGNDIWQLLFTKN